MSRTSQRIGPRRKPPQRPATVILAFMILLLPMLGGAQLSRAQSIVVLYSFQGAADGKTPFAFLAGDRAGNLYGTTYAGGSNDMGTVFKLDAAGNETILHSFSGSDGLQPLGGLVRDSANNLYGTTW